MSTKPDQAPRGASSITVESTEGYAGLTTYRTLLRVPHDDFTMMIPRVRYTYESLIVASLAGDFAERLVAKRTRGSTSDRHKVADFVMDLVGSEELANAYVSWLSVWSRSIVTNQVLRPALDALVEALMARVTLTGAEAEQAIYSAMSRSQ